MYQQRFIPPEDFQPVALHQLNPARYPHILQSVAPQQQGQYYDIIFTFPGESLQLDQTGLWGHQSSYGTDFLQALDNWWQQEAHPSPNTNLPFHGGWLLYLGYELAQQIEPCLQHCLPLPADLPTAVATRFHTALIFEHQSKNWYFVAESGYEQHWTEIATDLQQLTTQAQTKLELSASNIITAPAADYLNGIGKIKQHIQAGDIFQANLSRGWQLELPDTVNAASLYRQLCIANPAPFAALASWQNFAIISSSPERLLRIHKGIAETRPIAGTRPRADNPAQDQVYSAELLAHPKEQAEHIMLVDLERNDLGRICEAGSIQVDELLTLESYAHVHHIVSNIRGQLRSEITPGMAIGALFPGGTITGCPKVRCMEILAELEQNPRGPYTGSLGYLNRDGSMDLNILIRSMVKIGQHLSFRTGAGIVADSDPTQELTETQTKALGMLRALGAVC